MKSPQNKFNRLTMDQLLSVILTIDKVHTAAHICAILAF